MGLHGAARTLARMARLLEGASPELSLPQYRVLATVAAGDERASRLAARLALAKPTITAAVDGLVERGLLARCDVAGDRRAVCLRVTGEGGRALATAEDAMAGRLAPVFDRVSDRSAVLTALADLERALDEVIRHRMAENR